MHAFVSQTHTHNTYTYTHVYIHAYIHTHTYTHTHIPSHHRYPQSSIPIYNVFITCTYKEAIHFR